MKSWTCNLDCSINPVFFDTKPVPFMFLTGVESIHQLTRRYQYKLRVDVEDFEGKKAYALYNSFSVGSEADGYKLRVSGFVDGGAGETNQRHKLYSFNFTVSKWVITTMNLSKQN